MKVVVKGKNAYTGEKADFTIEGKIPGWLVEAIKGIFGTEAVTILNS